MKTWDWKQAKKQNCSAHLLFLRQHYDKPLTESEYIEGMQALEHNHSLKGRNAPSHLKYEYKNLKENFGFFSAPR